MSGSRGIAFRRWAITQRDKLAPFRRLNAGPERETEPCFGAI
jgi:hypothetical protein